MHIYTVSSAASSLVILGVHVSLCSENILTSCSTLHRKKCRKEKMKPHVTEQLANLSNFGLKCVHSSFSPLLFPSLCFLISNLRPERSAKLIKRMQFSQRVSNILFSFPSISFIPLNLCSMLYVVMYNTPTHAKSMCCQCKTLAQISI